MSLSQDRRPRFYEEQYLGSRDLDAIVDHARIARARHALGGHVWGVAAGLELIERPSPRGGIDVFVQAGFAWDGLGRPIWVGSPSKVSPALFARIPFDAAEDGGSPEGRLVDVWIEALATRTGEAPPGFESCDAGDSASRIVEGFRISAGERPTHEDRHVPVTIAGRSADATTVRSLADSTAPDVTDESIPEQELPDDWDTALWLLPLGVVRWLPSADPLEQGGFVARDATDLELSRRRRRYMGVVAETVNAPRGPIRLRSRSAPYDPTVWTDDLAWVEGDLRVDGDARLLGGGLELLHADATDGDVPLRIDRDDTDIVIQIGTTHDGENRLIAGPIVGGSREPALTVRDDSRVGVGIDTPDRPLAVRAQGGSEELVSFVAPDGTTHWHLNQRFDGRSGLNFVETGVADGRLYLAAGGNVGIQTTEPTNPLHVTGNRGIRQNRLYISGAAGWSSIAYNAHHNAANSDWAFPDPARTAMTIEMDDAHAGGEGRFAVWSTRIADTDAWTGPHLAVRGETGNVGVGTGSPNRPLAVRASGGAEELVSFLAPSGATRWHLNQLLGGRSGLNFVETGIADGRLYLAAGGNVGIQTTQPTHPLHVNAVTGIRQNRLHLSGGAGGSSLTYNAHRNQANNAWVFPDPARTAMTIELDDAHAGEGRFAVYSTRQSNTGAWTGPHLTVRGEGNVGVGTSSPAAKLHVRGGSSGAPSDASLHAALIENPTNSTEADVLALRLTSSSLDDSNNFITFFNGSSVVGAIEGNGSGGITLDVSGADWAEWLPLAEGEEALDPGDVVGVHGGHVSRRTEGADHLMVVSTAPVVLANRPPEGERERHARIAFVGQAPVKVRGPVRAGDHLVATGEDGVAEARRPDKATLAEHARCLGIAWEDSRGRGVRTVQAAIGTRPAGSWRALADEVESLRKEIATLKDAATTRRKR